MPEINRSSHFKCECQHCHGHLECPAEAAGLEIECPHCGKTTGIPFLSPPKKSSGVAKKIIITSVIVAAILVPGVIWANRHAQENARRRAEAAAAAQLAAQQAAAAEALAKDPLAQAGWKMSDIRFEKSPGSKLVLAVGTLSNTTDRRRFGVRIKLDLFNAAEQKLAGASDYQAAIEPHSRWQFTALVVDASAVTAKVAAIEESP